MRDLSYINKEALYGTVDQIASSQYVPFIQSFLDGMDAQMKASAQNGIEYSMFKLDDDQYRRMRKAGVENAPKLGDRLAGSDYLFLQNPEHDFDIYHDVARYQGLNEDNDRRNRILDYDQRIYEINQKHPELKLLTTREMFDRVYTEAREAERKVAESRRTTSGHIAEFLGQAVSSLYPATDPFNFSTMAIGGVGETALMRIATEAGANSLIEGVNQFSSVQEQREILGLDHGVEQALMQMATAGVGAGLLQGSGELLYAGGKKLFSKLPKDEPPSVHPPTQKEDIKLLEYKPINPSKPEQGFHSGYSDNVKELFPYGITRSAESRAVKDLEYVAKQLEAWDGEAPLRIRPRTSTAIPDAVNTPEIKGVSFDGPGKYIDDVARDIDPDLFRKYDALAQTKETLRRWLSDIQKDKVNTEIESLQQRVDYLDGKLESPDTKVRMAKKYEAEKQGLLKQIEQTIAEAKKSDTPDMARLREKLMHTDEKMRDLAPLVSRAYAQAKKQWELELPDRAAVRQMIREGRTDLPTQKPGPLDGLGYEDVKLENENPHSKQPIADTTKPEPKEKADLTDEAVAEKLKVLDTDTDGFKASVKSLLNSEDNEVSLAGYDVKLNLDKDKMLVPNEDGSGFKEVTLRKFLEDQLKVDDEFKAVTTCSI